MHSVNQFMKVLRIVRIYSKFIITIEFLPDFCPHAMTPVKPADTCTTDQLTRTEGDAGADGNTALQTAPRRTLTLRTGGAGRIVGTTDGLQRASREATRAHGALITGHAVPARDGAAPVLPTPLKRLTAGRKELAIAHAGATYVLRVTKANKLILTKDSEETLS